MGASFSTSRKRKSSESDPPPTAPQPQKKLKRVAKPVTVDDYQVFLSFRGPDTRNNFTDVLYEHMAVRVGIWVFRDEDEIPVGQKIDIILQAIENSEICVPILSEHFASSAWCLREVEKMVELEKKVIPIFYKISPDDVRFKTDLYKSAMAEHEVKYGKEQVEKWKTALKKIAKIKGREVSANTRYTEFCKKFVDEVLRKLRPRKRLNTDHLVGMDSAIESVMSLLDIESPDVRFIGIQGMGGIGKTTLAKALFKELSADFDCSFFLGDVRELSSRCNGLQDLQKQLQEGLDPEFTRGCNSFRGIEERFRRKKVLIVLDDVNKSEQIEKLAGQSTWFGSGSRIIVTSRNVDVLKKYGGLDQKEVRFFEMVTLKYDQSLELFQWYAFRKEKPPAILETISREIVSSAGGLPLALKVVGSHLFNVKDERMWTEVLERSREVPDRHVKKRLRISYDALEPDQKKFFLDIACVSDMKDKVKSVYMWEASKLYPHYNLAALSSMSLVKIKDDEIWMHDLLKDLGKDIDREECIKVPGKRTRVCGNEEALNVLLSKKGKEEVEVLCVDKPLEILSLTSEHFATFQELRLLKLVGTIEIEGDFTNLLPKLVWLTWHLCPPILKATNLHMKNLVVLNLSYSFITESWGGWSLIHTLNNLKDLDLSACQNLTRTPDFSETNRLERLELRDCIELREIHGSIGKLKRLKYLNLNKCYSLGGLPNEIGCLVNLEELWLSRPHGRKSRSTFKLPNSIGNLKSLRVFELRGQEITDIPDSIGGLAKLKCLYLHTREKVLPESLGDLESLVRLELRCTGMSALPNSIGRLAKLQLLILQECYNLEELPESLGNLESLGALILSHYERIRELPSSFGGLVKLERLDLGGCCNLAVLPESFGCLESLTKLDLSLTKISELPSSFGGLVKLEHLDLGGCRNLEVLPDTLGSLRELKVLNLRGCNLRKLPASIGLMKKLEEMDISFGAAADAAVEEEVPMEIGSLSSLRVLTLRGSSISMLLPSTISQLLLLEVLNLFGNIQLRELTDLPLSLIVLRVSSRSLQKIPDLSRLTNLRALVLLNSDDYRWPQQQLPKSKFEGIDKITKLGVANASALLQFDLMGSLTQLKSLSLDFRPDLSLDHGSVLPSASSLDLLGTSQARLGGLKLPDLSSLKNLSKLVLWNFMIEDGGLLESLGIQHLRNLTNFSLIDCGVELIELICLSKNLTSLTVSNWGSLKTLPDLSDLKTLRSLEIRGCKKIVEIPGLGNLESLECLCMSGCDSLERLENLSKLEKLSLLTLWDCPKLRIVEGTEGLAPSLLRIGNCRSLQNVDELKKRSKRGLINGFEFVNFG